LKTTSDFGEDVAAIRVDSPVLIVDTSAFTSCGDQSGGGCVVAFSSASEGGAVNGLHGKVTLIARALRLQRSTECGFHSSFAAVAILKATRLRKPFSSEELSTGQQR
jgi:hypothetical protein